jgi:hypothetical protein
MRIKSKKNIIALACCLTMLNPATIHAKSLFGDYSCSDWGKLESAPKKLWANAFFAPLSLTFKSIKKTNKDHYNDDPNSYEIAIDSINGFCESHPDSDVNSGAANYLKILSGD